MDSKCNAAFIINKLYCFYTNRFIFDQIYVKARGRSVRILYDSFLDVEKTVVLCYSLTKMTVIRNLDCHQEVDTVLEGNKETNWLEVFKLHICIFQNALTTNPQLTGDLNLAEISPALMHFCGEANLNVNLGCFPELPTGSTDLKITESVLEEIIVVRSVMFSQVKP